MNSTSWSWNCTRFKLPWLPAGPAPEAAASSTATTLPSVVALQAIAREDGQMRDLLRQKRQLEQGLERLKLRFASGHKSVEEAVLTLKEVEEEIEQYAQDYRTGMAEGSIRPAGGRPFAGGDTSQLRQRERNLLSLVEGARARTLNLGRKQLQIESLQRDAAEKQARLSETKTRIEQLSVESSVGGRITVLSYGEQPLAPSRAIRSKVTLLLGIVERCWASAW